MNARRTLLQAVKIVVSVGLIVFLVAKLKPANLLSSLAEIDPVLLAVGLAVYAVSILLGALEWHYLLDAGGVRLPFARTNRFYFIGIFFNNFLPAGVGGDAVKIYDVTKIGNDPYRVFAITLLDRVIGIAGLCILALAASFVVLSRGGIVNLYLYMVIFAGCVAPAIALILNRHLSRQVRRLFGMIRLWGLGGKFDAIFSHLGEYRRLRSFLGRLTALAVLVQFLRVFVHILVAEALGVRLTPLNYVHFFVFVPILSLIMILPISINGLGIREGAGILLFTQIGMTGEQALLVELVTYAVMVAVSLLGGVFFMQRHFRRATPDNEVIRDV